MTVAMPSNDDTVTKVPNIDVDDSDGDVTSEPISTDLKTCK